jgi:hypothetical protein
MLPKTDKRITIEARLCADVANAALKAAREFDAARCACGVADMAVAVAGDDEIAKLMLAKHLVRLAREIEPQLPLYVKRWQ